MEKNKVNESSTEQASKRQLVGLVVSDKMTKTVVVEVSRRVRHARYPKYVSHSIRYKAHSELGAKTGDRVSMIESRPLSRHKRWVVTKIVEKATE